LNQYGTAVTAPMCRSCVRLNGRVNEVSTLHIGKMSKSTIAKVVVILCFLCLQHKVYLTCILYPKQFKQQTKKQRHVTRDVVIAYISTVIEIRSTVSEPWRVEMYSISTALAIGFYNSLYKPGKPWFKCLLTTGVPTVPYHFATMPKSLNQSGGFHFHTSVAEQKLWEITCLTGKWRFMYCR